VPKARTTTGVVIGPLHVSTGACNNPLYKAFIEAGQQAGYAFTADMNGHRQEGFGPMDMTTDKGRRWSTAMAYLRPVLKRNNLRLLPEALVTRLLFDGTPTSAPTSAPASAHNPPRATGVELRHQGQTKRLTARREVILCGGAINSPQLLQLSGIGDPAHLEPLGITAVAARKGVGENLQDHLEADVQYACKEPITLYAATNPLVKLQDRPGVAALQDRAGGHQPLLSRAASFAAKPGSSTPTCSTTFCPWRCATTAMRQPPATASRPT